MNKGIGVSVVFVLKLMVLIVIFLFAARSEAAVSCNYLGEAKSFNGNMALQISNIAVPRDAPNGTILHQQTFVQNASGVGLECTAPPGKVYNVYQVEGLSARSGYYEGGSYKVYESGVKGIGVAWRLSNDPNSAIGSDLVVDEEVWPGCTRQVDGQIAPEGKCLIHLKSLTSVAVVLIKTGPVGEGVINGGRLGRLKYSRFIDGSEKFAISEVGVTGNINVVSRTCKTSDVIVQMGSYKTSDFNGPGSLGKAVGFDISLSDCPGFPGTYGGWSASSELGVVTPVSLGPNTISIRVDPVNTPFDAAKGVLSLTEGVDSATGVGVQLLISSTRALPLSRNLLIGRPAADVSTFTVTLFAQYLQTANTVIAGKANAVATYTIIYQ